MSAIPTMRSGAQMRQLQEENAGLERRLREQAASLEVADKKLRDFSHSVSHDLRAPLRAIDSFSKLLAQNHAAQMPADARYLLERVLANAARMEHLIDCLLELSRLSRAPLTRRPVDVATLVREVLEKLHEQEHDRRVECRVGDLPDAVGDRVLLQQLFVNLLSNAFKFTRKTAHAIVEVGCRQDEGSKVYFVRDNGAGFDMRYADKLFGVFQRLHRASDFEGTGVGLSLVQCIVQRHGGRVWVEAAPDEGATFQFTLPD